MATFSEGTSYPAGEEGNRTEWGKMLYGGGSPPLWTTFFGGPLLQGIPTSGGSIKMRTADRPWGPWSAPQEVLWRDHPEIRDAICRPPLPTSCMNPLQFPLHTGAGELYAPAIVQAWDESNGNDGVIGWFVSLWNPYEVHQMRTEIENLHVP